MAKITAKAETTAEKTDAIPSVAPQTWLDEVLRRLETLEKENQELKDAKNPMKKAREIYDWPRKYSYKLWWGVPVLWYTSVKKDASKDLLYKAPTWQYVSNHYLKLELANWKSVQVEVNEFGISHTKSEKQFCKVISDWRNVQWYEFETDEYGKILVLPSVIN